MPSRLKEENLLEMLVQVVVPGRAREVFAEPAAYHIPGDSEGRIRNRETFEKERRKPGFCRQVRYPLPSLRGKGQFIQSPTSAQGCLQAFEQVLAGLEGLDGKLHNAFSLAMGVPGSTKNGDWLGRAHPRRALGKRCIMVRPCLSPVLEFAGISRPARDRVGRKCRPDAGAPGESPAR